MAYHAHKQCIDVRSVRKALAALRDELKAALDPYGDLADRYASQLAAIRACESGGDYTVVDSSGTYYGAYQFDLETWGSVGGHGLPNQASPAEQDYRAALLYSRAGPAPWPVCGV